MSTRVAIGLVIASILSLVAYFALQAYAPDLRSDKSGGTDALSKSAVGFAGTRFLLEHTGMTIRLGRTPPPNDTFSLVIVTPEAFGSEGDIAALTGHGPALIVLPKWYVGEQPLHPGWVMKVRAWDPKIIGSTIDTLSKKAAIRQEKGSKTHLKGIYPRFQALVPARALTIDNAQTISGDNLEADIVDDQGHAVLAQIKGTQTYILAEPDLMNNHGIGDEATARFAYDLVTMLRTSDRPISFDVTLNGFAQSPSFLKTLFEPPFLGATLCAILAAGFIAFHAFRRFGAAVRPDRVFAFGKRALADNTAAVIRMMKREPRMAQPYAQAMLNVVATQVGVSREKASSGEWIRLLEKRGGYRFDELSKEAAQVHDTNALIKVATKIYEWRRGILNEHR
jgi:hypothetical protein